MRFKFLIYFGITSNLVLAQDSNETLGGIEREKLAAELGDISKKKISLPFTGSVTTDADLLISDDVTIERYSADFEVDLGDTKIGFGYRRTEYDVDFSGPGLFSGNLQDGTDTYSLSFDHRWNRSYSSSLTFGGYEGFTNFRSLWFPEFFRQESGGFPGFRDLDDPFGFSVGLTNTYSFANGIDSLALNLSYSRDRIVPAQQAGFDPITGPFLRVGNDTLETFSAGLTGNFYLTNKLTSEWSAKS